jgi:hypothetical protein
MEPEREAMRHAQLMLGRLYKLVRDHKIDSVGVCGTLITVMHGLSAKNPKLESTRQWLDSLGFPRPTEDEAAANLEWNCGDHHGSD